MWRELIDTRDIAPGEIDDAWLYRIGVPMPIAGIADTRDGEHLRHVTMGKGIHFDQVATEWRENERVSWRYRFDEDSFPAGALDDHVRIGGHYFDLGETQYSLVPQRRSDAAADPHALSREHALQLVRGADGGSAGRQFRRVVLRFYARRAEQAAQPQRQARLR